MPKYTTDPEAVIAIETGALALATSGADRISVKAIMEDVRSTGLQVNNTDSAKIARDLIAKHPHLGGLIELRSLGRRGANKARDLIGPDVMNDPGLRAAVVALCRKAYHLGWQHGKRGYAE